MSVFSFKTVSIGVFKNVHFIGPEDFLLFIDTVTIRFSGEFCAILIEDYVLI